MLRLITVVVAFVVLLSGLVVVLVLGEAWLLGRLFPLDLWHLALLVLACMAALLYAGTRIIEVVGLSSMALDWEEDEEDDDMDLRDTVGPPPWRRSSPQRRDSSRRKK